MAIHIAFTGGGTGGHVFPGIAVIEELRKKSDDIEIFWIGSGKKLERDITARFDIPYYSLPAGKLRRYLSLRNFFDIFKLAAGFIGAIILLKRLNADLLFSKGGYVAVAPVLAAWVLRIPVVIHESDRDPGLATRISARYADTILLPYARTLEEHFSGSRKEVIVTGNPVRSELMRGSAERGRKLLNIKPGSKLVLVLGGSQGARQVNLLIAGLRDRLLQHAAIVHQMGALDFVPSRVEGYITAALFDSDFPDILAAADVVISRAGAGTVWENGVLGKAAVLIPLGNLSSRGDQVRNAELFVQEGAAEVLSGADATADRLLERTLHILQDHKTRKSMGRNALRICDPSASGRIADILLVKAGNKAREKV